MRAFFLAGLLALAQPVVAGTYPVDDSASTVLSPSVNMRWDDAAPRPGQRPTVSGKLGVVVRLDVSPWKGQMAKIYMTLPPQSIGPVQVTWTSRGRLLPGVLRGGDRALVYAGPITDAMIEDTIFLAFQADGNRLFKSEQLHFSFEIDTQP